MALESLTADYVGSLCPPPTLPQEGGIQSCQESGLARVENGQPERSDGQSAHQVLVNHDAHMAACQVSCRTPGDLAGQLSKKLTEVAKQRESADIATEGVEDADADTDAAPATCRPDVAPVVATRAVSSESGAVCDPLGHATASAPTPPSGSPERDGRVHASPSPPMPGPRGAGWEDRAGVRGPSTPTRMLGRPTPSHESVRACIRALSSVEVSMSDEDLAMLREKIKSQKEQKDDAFPEVRVRTRGVCGAVLSCICCVCARLTKQYVH